MTPAHKQFRLIVHPKMDGRMNMAIDESLLLSVQKASQSPVIRVYGFNSPTLSFGRFQRIRKRLRIESLQANNVVVVRRPTGGQAVLHDNELTYSVVLAKEHMISYRKRTVYSYIAQMLLAVLKMCGIDAVSNGTGEGDIHNPDCFGTPGEYEILSSEGRKLVGSAQVTTRTACMQHGSIPLDSSHRDIVRYLLLDHPFKHDAATSIQEESKKATCFCEFQTLFVEFLRQQIASEESFLLDSEQKRAQTLMDEKYSVESWNLMY